MNTLRAKSVLILCISTLFIFSSCVSLKKYNSVAGDLEKCKDERKKLEAKARQTGDLNTANEKTMARLMNEIRQLKDDTARMNTEIATLQWENTRVKGNLDLEQATNLKNLKGKDRETRNLLNELQGIQEDLQNKEDELNGLGKTLQEKEKRLNELSSRLDIKEKRVNELEAILHRQDSIVKALKMAVNNALLGYIDKGLSVNIRNGKVYVSLEESLLFASASWQVSEGGMDVLKKISKVLESNQEINVLIEGHTDNVPYKGNQQVKDNWDLSVMRATSVLKILVDKSNIKPERLTASGRSEYQPIDPENSKEARAKNRRTEIILSPKMDELFKIIE